MNFRRAGELLLSLSMPALRPRHHAEVQASEHDFPETLRLASREMMASYGGMGTVQHISPRVCVADKGHLWVVRNRAGKPALMVSMSPANFPHAVYAANARAQAVRAKLDEPNSAAVLLPEESGYCDGLSYAITRFMRPLFRHGSVSRWGRRRVGPRVFAWLGAVTRQTVADASEQDVFAHWLAPLRRLAQYELVSETLRACAKEAAQRLDSGHWKPLNVLAHNDLWVGNVLRSPTDVGRPGFALIDWGASQIQGYPVYDLVRAAMSFHLTASQFAREISVHADALRCEPSTLRWHLCAALADLGEHRGEWPASCFAATAQACIAYLDRGMRSLER